MSCLKCQLLIYILTDSANMIMCVLCVWHGCRFWGCKDEHRSTRHNCCPHVAALDINQMITQITLYTYNNGKCYEATGQEELRGPDQAYEKAGRISLSPVEPE